MNQMDELIAEHCPAGVRYLPLGETCLIKNGRDWKTQEAGDIPVYGSGGRMDVAVKLPAYDQPTVLLPRKGSLQVQYVDEPFWNVDTVFYTICDPQLIEPKFLFYLMQTVNLGSISTSSTRPSLTQTALAKIMIPVPPLEVQRAVVDILDKLTALEAELDAELEAELEARKKQYEYYRNLLVSKKRFVSCDWNTLAEIASIRTGSKPNLIDTAGEFPYVNAGITPSGFTNSSNTSGGAITIPSRGQGGAGHVGYQSLDFWCGPLCYRIESKSTNLLNKFIYFYLKNIQDDLVDLRKIGSIPAVNKSDLGAVKIPLPSIEEQNRIVEILDKFDALVNDLSSGLPAEIAARRKQYEYYRDQLLRFKELAS